MSRSLRIVSMRITFAPSYMVIHQCISVSYSLDTKCYIQTRQTDGQTDRVHSYNSLSLCDGDF